MNRLMMKRSAKNLTLLALLGLATTQTAWAQTPPSWLNWSDKSDTAQAATSQVPQADSQAATPQPLAPQPLGVGETGANANTSSGQAVIIQNLLDSVSRLQEQVRDLRGQNEEQENQIQRLQKAQQSAFSSFDDRLSKLEQSGAPVPPTVPATNAAAVSAPPVPAPASPAPASGQDAAAGAKQQALYNAAFAQLKDGRYDQAITGFQAAIDADPRGQWAPSALFWQGETYYVEQKRDKAETAYRKILTQFPNSDRVPDALLKTGYIAYDENKNKQARAIFQQVISKYPQSQAANLAKQRLARMDAEKR